MDERQEKFESLVTGMMNNEYGIVDDFIPAILVDRLREKLKQRLEQGKMQPAGIGQRTAYHENREVRRDQISWIEDDHSNQPEEDFNRHIWSFLDYLNETCYTGLNAFESHYALYGKGSFYTRHRDQFTSDSGRKYSVVLYLNEPWNDEDGGQLVLYQENQQIRILPKGGRAVFFQSDRIEHEVLSAVKPRMSIAGWMKRI